MTNRFFTRQGVVMPFTSNDVEVAYNRGYAQGARDLLNAISEHLPDKHRAIIRTWVHHRRVDCRLANMIQPSELDSYGGFTTNIQPPLPDLPDQEPSA